MIQEYLLQEANEKDAVSAYNPEGIEKRIFSINNETCWSVHFSKEGENEKIAKQLSDVDDYIQNHFNITMLEDGCSAYFNVRLYPLISEFEYKLRKLLYLTSAINPNDESASTISDLDSQDFGQLFTLLFIDSTFMEKVKIEIKNQNRESFAKTNVIAAIKAIDENTLWDKLLGENTVPTLRNRFQDVRSYLNDVMHSHHLNWNTYKDILSLYKTINSELNKALREISVVESKTPSKPAFNQTLNKALRAQEQLFAQADVLNQRLERIYQLSNLYSKNSALSDAAIKWDEVSSAYVFSPEWLRIHENLGLLSKANSLSLSSLESQVQFKNLVELKANIPPAIQKIKELTQTINKPQSEIPTELLKLQKSLESLHLQEDSEAEEK